MDISEGVKVFYGPPDPDPEDTTYRLIPGPMISISYTPNYANDTVVGITNKISLNGTISNYIQNTQLVQQNLQEFSTQSFGSGLQIIATESGNVGVATEGDKTLVVSFGNDPNRSGDVIITISDPPSNPTLFTKSDHGLQPGDMIILNTDGKLPDGLEENRIYYILEEGWTEDSFIVSDTPDGPQNVTSGTQTGTHTLSVENDPGNVWIITSGGNGVSSLRQTTRSVYKFQDLLNRNGSVLTVLDKNNVKVIEAVGGILRSLSIDQGENGWSKTLPFSADIDFSYINFFGENLSCNNYFTTNAVVDGNQYPIKSFNDGWNIDINTESFGHIYNSDVNNLLNISNSTIQLSYNVSAVGLDYYQTTDPPTFKPAWEIAKHFVQEKLYDQVSALLSGILVMSGVICSGNGDTQTSTGGLLKDITNDYTIFNETINCSFSELDGSFNASYNSIIKKNNNSSFDNGKVKHTITKNFSSNHENNTAKVKNNISINGTIEGLIEGGLIRANKHTFQLPRNGSFLVVASGSNRKFDNAAAVWNLLKNGDDLNDSFKTALGISYSYLGQPPPACSGSTITPSPLPRSFSLTENKIDGTIEYQIEYEHNECVVRDGPEANVVVQNISTDYSDHSPIFAEFILPDLGVVLQDMKTTTAREISFTITGRDKPKYRINTPYTTLPSSHILLVANYDVDVPEILQNAGFPDYEGSNWVVKNKSEDINIIDGSYNVQLTYVCMQPCTPD